VKNQFHTFHEKKYSIQYKYVVQIKLGTILNAPKSIYQNQTH